MFPIFIYAIANDDCYINLKKENDGYLKESKQDGLKYKKLVSRYHTKNQISKLLQYSTLNKTKNKSNSVYQNKSANKEIFSTTGSCGEKVLYKYDEYSNTLEISGEGKMFNY